MGQLAVPIQTERGIRWVAPNSEDYKREISSGGKELNRREVEIKSSKSKQQDEAIKQQGKELYKLTKEIEKATGKPAKVAVIDGRYVVLSNDFTQNDINYLADIVKRRGFESTFNQLNELLEKQNYAKLRSQTADIISQSLAESKARTNEYRLQIPSESKARIDESKKQNDIINEFKYTGLPNTIHMGNFNPAEIIIERKLPPPPESTIEIKQKEPYLPPEIKYYGIQTENKNIEEPIINKIGEIRIIQPQPPQSTIEIKPKEIILNDEQIQSKVTENYMNRDEYAIHKINNFFYKLEKKSAEQGQLGLATDIRTLGKGVVFVFQSGQEAGNIIYDTGKSFVKNPVTFTLLEFPVSVMEGIGDLMYDVTSAGFHFIKGGDTEKIKQLINPKLVGSIMASEVMVGTGKYGTRTILKPLRETKIEIQTSEPIIRTEIEKLRTRETLPESPTRTNKLTEQETPRVYVGKPEIFGEVPEILKNKPKDYVVEEIGVISGYFGKLKGNLGKLTDKLIGEDIIYGKSIRVGNTIFTDIRTKTQSFFLETYGGKTIQRKIITDEGKSKIIDTIKYKNKQNLETIGYEKLELPKKEIQTKGLTKIEEGINEKTIYGKVLKENNEIISESLIKNTKQTNKQIAIATRNPIELQKEINLKTLERKSGKIYYEKPIIEISGEVGTVKPQPIYSEIMKGNDFIIARKIIPSPITSEALGKLEMSYRYVFEKQGIIKPKEYAEKIGEQIKKMLESKKGEYLLLKNEAIIPKQKVNVKMPESDFYLNMLEVEKAFKTPELKTIPLIIKENTEEINKDIYLERINKLKKEDTIKKENIIYDKKLTTNVDPDLEKISYLNKKIKENIIQKENKIFNQEITQNIEINTQISPKREIKFKSEQTQIISPKQEITFKSEQIPIIIPSLKAKLKNDFPKIDFKIEFPKEKIIQPQKQQKIKPFQEDYNKINKDIAYITKIKRKGKFIDISKPTTKESALDIGARAVSQTLGATFKIERVKANPTPISTSGEFKALRNQLREYKIFGSRKIPLKDEYIQKRQFRLSSIGEKKEIKQARKIKWSTKKAKLF